jgi:streptogramin lyase
MRVVWALLCLCTIPLLGCSLATNSENQPAPAPVAITPAATPLHGIVHGGQQPIIAASVYLFAVNNTGYGQPSASLLLDTSATTGDTTEDSGGRYYVTTNATGGFTIAAGDYSCGQSGPQQVYLYAVGGNPQVNGTPNSAAGLMAVLGQCVDNAFSSLTGPVQMDEVTTIATAYALAGYATDATDISGSGTALAATGMANAAAGAANLASITTGLALVTTPAGNGTAPQLKTDTLANALAACINSSGPGSGACTTLFTSAMNGATEPSDTATAAINIAHNPATGIPALYGLSTPSAPFQPSLSVQPNDWTLAITYTGAGLGTTEDLAVDGSGNIWVTNYTLNSISELSPAGAAMSPSTGYTGGGLDLPFDIAIDLAGNAWVSDIVNPGRISEFSPSGTALSPSTGYTGGGLEYPWGIAVDGSGDVWAASCSNNSLNKFNSEGMPISSSTGYTGGGLSCPEPIAIDGSGNVWAGNGGGILSKTGPSGNPISPSPNPFDPSGGYSGGGLQDAGFLAIDASGDAWASDYFGNHSDRIAEFSSSGAALSPSGGFTGGGLNESYGIAVDGLGNVWVTNEQGSSISEFSPSGTALSPANDGYFLPSGTPGAVAVDGSGNVWVATGTSGVTEFVGLGSPVVTPLAAGVKNNTLGTRP